jgi:prevent-host-death family protein
MKKPLRRSASSSTNVRVAEFRAHLSAYLRRVQGGDVLTVCDRNQPIVKVIPFAPPTSLLTIRRAQRRVRDLPLPPIRTSRCEVTSLDLLLDDRSGR